MSTINITPKLDVCYTYQARSDMSLSKNVLMKTRDCKSLYPYLCQKLSVVDCKNGCFQHGLCAGRTCLCDSGWEGKHKSVSYFETIILG